MPKSTKPPTFRGSDFAMRFAQGQWSEERIIESINASSDYKAIPYGRSQVGPENPEEIPAYWEKYIQAESVGKRPDILVFFRSDFERLEDLLPEDPTLAQDDDLEPFLEVAICAIEAENSLWVAEEMTDYGTKKITKLNFVAPTIIVKEEDAPELEAWQAHYKIPICIVQVFYDRGYIVELDQVTGAVNKINAALRGEGIASLGLAELDEKESKKLARELQKNLGVFVKEQKFADSRTGTSTGKIIYRTHYSVAHEFGRLDPADKPKPTPKVKFETNGKIMAYVHFEGGTMRLSKPAIDLFERLHRERGL